MNTRFHSLSRKLLSAQHPAGATLTEVMVALLIMGIGIVGVMSLFPASVLRSLQGHTLTVGTTLRFNAESYLRVHPDILLDPDRAMPVASGAPDLDGNGNRWDDQSYGVFMVDPMGLITFGIADGTQIAGAGTLPRYSAGFTTLATAEEVFSGLDQWDVKFEGFPTTGSLATGGASQSLTFSGLSDQAVYLGTGLAPTRAVIFNKLGTSCQSRNLTATLNPTSPLGNTITWSGDLPGAMSNGTFSNADVGSVRVEQRDLRFTWLLTARGQTPQSNTEEGLKYDVDIVVFYKRGYPPTDNVSYGNTTAPNLVFRANSLDAVVTWDPATTANPFLKRGSHVLDPENGYWYRVENYVEGTGTATITLATPARANGRLAMFMKGIVDVFPLRQVTFDNPRLN